jgi:DNA processing protein
MPPERLISWLALHLLPGIGPLAARRALAVHPDPEELAFRVAPSAWSRIPGIDASTAERIAASRRALRERAESERDEAVRRGVRMLTRDDPDYPSMIASLPDAPVVLYVRGEIPEGRARVALVGARRATAYGRAVARELATDLAGYGAEIVSGGARGIDTCSHEGALSAGGRSVAVFGCGFRYTYPPENGALFESIAAAGALLSEFPMSAPPLGENFPRRNRLIAALAAATVVVEATEKSGALHTASYALEQGREVMAVPGPVTSPQSRGCHSLIQQGAKLVRDAADVVDELSPMYKAALREPGRATAPDSDGTLDPLEPDEVAVLGLFDDPRPVHVDLLADAAPFGIARLQAALFALVLRGSLDQLPGGYYVARPRRGPVEP